MRGKAFEHLGPWPGALLTVSHVSAMFPRVIMSALQAIRREVPNTRVLLLYLLYRGVFTRIVQTFYLLDSLPSSE